MGGRERERQGRGVIGVDGIRRRREGRRFTRGRETGELTLDVGDGLEFIRKPDPTSAILTE